MFQLHPILRFFSGFCDDLVAQWYPFHFFHGSLMQYPPKKGSLIITGYQEEPSNSNKRAHLQCDGYMPQAPIPFD